MFVILSYDVNAKHCGKYRRICKRYLRPMHESLFEGELTGTKLMALKRELQRIMEPELDSVRIYELNSAKYAQVEMLGNMQASEYII